MSATADRARAKLTATELRALRAALKRELRAEQTAGKPPRVRETPEVAAAARRMVRAVGDRAAADVEALPLLADLGRAVDLELHRAVQGARDPQRHARPYSWAEIATALGMKHRQAAQQRFSR